MRLNQLRLIMRLRQGLPDPFGTGTGLVRISLVFTRDLVDSVGIGSAVWYQMGPSHMETYRSSFEPVPCKQSGPYNSVSDPKRI